MQGWLQVDERGRQYLVRTGTGVVTAVVPLDEPDASGAHAVYRVEIYCDAPHGRPGAIRYSARPLVSSDDPLLEAARRALDEVWAVEWTVEWHRHDWIPDDLPIASLDLSTDATSRLAALDPVLLPEPEDVEVPDFLPASWDTR
jgi:RecA-family ATPase